VATQDTDVVQQKYPGRFLQEVLSLSISLYLSALLVDGRKSSYLVAKGCLPAWKMPKWENAHVNNIRADFVKKSSLSRHSLLTKGNHQIL
jgi:hypothetical protein